MHMSQSELEDLKYAKELLENPGLAARITDVLGTAVDKGFELLPAKWSEMVQQTTKESLRKALEFAVMTMDDRPRVSSWSFLHKMLAATSGAVGGAFGLPALAAELPVSTIIMLRSIAEYQNKFKLKFSAFLRQHSPYIPLSGIFSRLH